MHTSWFKYTKKFNYFLVIAFLFFAVSPICSQTIEEGNDLRWMYTELPPVEENAYALSVNQTPNKLIVAVRGKSNHPQAPYRLTLRSGEQIYYQAAWNPQSQDLIFDKSKFLSGILRIELTDKQGVIISERPVFLLNNNQIAT